VPRKRPRVVAGNTANYDGREAGMKTVVRRLERLEEPLRLAEQKCFVIAMTLAGRTPALDIGTCLQILDECGHFPKSPCAVANLSKIPDGLNAHETEAFLREHGAVLFSGLGR
jgi:hypothetical protein